MASFKIDAISFYAKVYRPDDVAEGYTIDAVANTKESQEKFKETGAKPLENKDGSPLYHDGYDGCPVYRLKRRIETVGGEKMGPPQVVDSQGAPITNWIGNGSKVRLYGSSYNWTYKGKHGINLGLNIVQVINLVEYDPVDKIEGGFVATPPIVDCMETNDLRDAF